MAGRASSGELGAVTSDAEGVGSIGVLHGQIVPALIGGYTLDGPAAEGLLDEGVSAVRCGEFVGIVENQAVRTDEVVWAIAGAQVVLIADNGAPVWSRG